MGHLLMENRNGLVDTRLTQATGTAEREAAASMLGDLPARGRITVGGDKLFDTQDFVAEMRRLGVTPHVAQHTNGRRSAIDGRTTRHAGYAVSQRPQTYRGSFWLDENRRRLAQDTPSRHRAGRLAIHPDGCRLQSCAHPQAACGLIDAWTLSKIRKSPR
jgi:hypothetical protein